MGESLGIWVSLARLMRGLLHAEILLRLWHHGLLRMLIHHWLLHGRRLVRVENHRLLVVHTHMLRLVWVINHGLLVVHRRSLTRVISHLWLVVHRRRLIRIISHGWLVVDRRRLIRVKTHGWLVVHRWLRLIRVKSHVRLWWVHRLILILIAHNVLHLLGLMGRRFIVNFVLRHWHLLNDRGHLSCSGNEFFLNNGRLVSDVASVLRGPRVYFFFFFLGFFRRLFLLLLAKVAQRIATILSARAIART